MKFGTVYFIFSLLTLLLSCILNAILVRIAFKRKERVGFYRFFIYTFVIIDMFYSLSYTAAQPFWYAGPGVLAFFSIAPWNEYNLIVEVSYQIWFALFQTISLCSTCSFAYRYGLLCSPFVVSMFEQPLRFIISAFLLVAFYASTLYVGFLGFNESDNEITRTTTFVATIIFFTLNNIHPITMVYCGWEIDRTVKTRAMSQKLRNIHRRALKMLITQALNPLVLFFLPTSVNIIGMLTGADLGAVPRPLSLLFGLFPIFNPIIVIYFTEDYKRYLLGEATSVSVAMQPALSSQNTSSFNRRRMDKNTAVFVI